ncbi:MAG: hypothetical protein AB7S26_02460 [Sandaracinaceae bacterium]
MTRRACAIAVALSLIACDGPDFLRPSQVTSTRLLAVIAEPPEAEPGTDVQVSAMVAAPDGEATSLRITIDLSPRALASSAGQDLFAPAEPIELVDGALAGAQTATAIEELRALTENAGPGTAEQLVWRVYQEVGLIAFARVAVIGADGAIIVEGVKRIGLAPPNRASENPPPPRFALDDRWTSARAQPRFRCEPEGEPLRAAPGSTVVLAPDPDEGWLETYPLIDLSGATVEGVEAAYYAWFAPIGELAFDMTRVPDPSVEWTIPDDAPTGPTSVWLVVRDGHLGESACEARVEIAR